MQQNPGSWNITRLLLLKENQTSAINELSAFLCETVGWHFEGPLKSSVWFFMSRCKKNSTRRKVMTRSGLLEQDAYEAYKWASAAHGAFGGLLFYNQRTRGRGKHSLNEVLRPPGARKAAFLTLKQEGHMSTCHPQQSCIQWSWRCLSPEGNCPCWAVRVLGLPK